MLSIVNDYKHLGGYQTISGDLRKDARHKADVAMAAYAPIAVKVFGSSAIGLWLKLIFLHSLVSSKLLFNAHVVVPDVRYLKVLNRVYMRALRRISGHLNLGDSISDADVRKSVQQPSIELPAGESSSHIPGALAEKPSCDTACNAAQQTTR